MDTQRVNEAEIARIFGSAPFVRHLGLEPVNVEPGLCESRILLDDHHRQQDGFVHAGVQASMADHTAGAAAATLIGDDRLVLTAEFKVNLLRAATGRYLRCRAAVLKPGSALTVVESEVFSGDDEGHERLVAKATVTLAVIDKARYASPEATV